MTKVMLFEWQVTWNFGASNVCYLYRTAVSFLQTIIKNLSQSAVQETLKYTTLAAIMTSLAWPLTLVSGCFLPRYVCSIIVFLPWRTVLTADHSQRELAEDRL